MKPATHSGRFAYVFGWPILLAVLGAIGLASALVGNGVWDALSWAGLAAPLLIIARQILRSMA